MVQQMCDAHPAGPLHYCSHQNRIADAKVLPVVFEAYSPVAVLKSWPRHGTMRAQGWSFPRFQSGNVDKYAKSATIIARQALSGFVSLGIALLLAACGAGVISQPRSERQQKVAASVVARMQVIEDIAYAKPKSGPHSLNTLDIYSRPTTTGQRRRPVIVFIHGGGWNQGDKSFIGKPKNRVVPDYYTRQGYVFVALNFRLAYSRESPKATLADMAEDIAAALNWLNQNIARYGGQSDRFLLWGYSSGAHLAALMATDQSYLKRYDNWPSLISGVIAMDVPHYDASVSIGLLEAQRDSEYDTKRLLWLYRLFGKSEEAQQKFSPSAYITKTSPLVPFLLLSARHNRGRHQSLSLTMTERFQEQLQSAGVESKHAHFPQYGHTDLIRNSAGGQLGTVITDFLRSLSL